MSFRNDLRLLAGLLALLGFLFSATAISLPPNLSGVLNAKLCSNSADPVLPGQEECCGACVLVHLAQALPPAGPALGLPGTVATIRLGIPDGRLEIFAPRLAFASRAPPLA